MMRSVPYHTTHRRLREAPAPMVSKSSPASCDEGGGWRMRSWGVAKMAVGAAPTTRTPSRVGCPNGTWRCTTRTPQPLPVSHLVLRSDDVLKEQVQAIPRVVGEAVEERGSRRCLAAPGALGGGRGGGGGGGALRVEDAVTPGGEAAKDRGTRREHGEKGVYRRATVVKLRMKLESSFLRIQGPAPGRYSAGFGSPTHQGVYSLVATPETLDMLSRLVGRLSGTKHGRDSREPHAPIATPLRAAAQPRGAQASGSDNEASTTLDEGLPAALPTPSFLSRIASFFWGEGKDQSEEEAAGEAGEGSEQEEEEEDIAEAAAGEELEGTSADEESSGAPSEDEEGERPRARARKAASEPVSSEGASDDASGSHTSSEQEEGPSPPAAPLAATAVVKTAPSPEALRRAASGRPLRRGDIALSQGGSPADATRSHRPSLALGTGASPDLASGASGSSSLRRLRSSGPASPPRIASPPRMHSGVAPHAEAAAAAPRAPLPPLSPLKIDMSNEQLGRLKVLIRRSSPGAPYTCSFSFANHRRFLCEGRCTRTAILAMTARLGAIDDALARTAAAEDPYRGAELAALRASAAQRSALARAGSPPAGGRKTADSNDADEERSAAHDEKPPHRRAAETIAVSLLVHGSDAPFDALLPADATVRDLADAALGPVWEGLEPLPAELAEETAELLVSGSFGSVSQAGGRAASIQRPSPDALPRAPPPHTHTGGRPWRPPARQPRAAQL